VLDIKWIVILVEGCKVAAMKSTEKFYIDPFEMECACKQIKPLIMTRNVFNSNKEHFRCEADYQLK